MNEAVRIADRIEKCLEEIRGGKPVSETEAVYLLAKAMHELKNPTRTARRAPAEWAPTHRPAKR